MSHFLLKSTLLKTGSSTFQYSIIPWARPGLHGLSFIPSAREILQWQHSVPGKRRQGGALPIRGYGSLAPALFIQAFQQPCIFTKEQMYQPQTTKGPNKGARPPANRPKKCVQSPGYPCVPYIRYGKRSSSGAMTRRNRLDMVYLFS
jgi:hypothetical protein